MPAFERLKQEDYEFKATWTTYGIHMGYSKTLSSLVWWHMPVILAFDS